MGGLIMIASARENVISLYRRHGYEQVPVQFNLCPALVAEYGRRYGQARSYDEHFGFDIRGVGYGSVCAMPFVPERWFPGETFKPGTRFSDWGVGHEPGSAAARHMTRMLHPLASALTRSDLAAYPFPDFAADPPPELVEQVARHHAQGLAVSASMECTIWETAWYLRGMDHLVADFVENPDFANDLLDRITTVSCHHAVGLARAGVDILCLGDDIGTQSRLMMSPATYRRWLKPRLRQVVDAAKAVNPAIIIQYHSCGHVTGLIRDLIEAGVEVLNPVQPESMDFAALHREFGHELSFNGVIGTQTVMPFGSPDAVRAAVHDALRLVGPRGGLLPCPTHLLEPEVPWANIEAYVAACRDWR
jgi:uroporphyrinogen decarboxylase